MDLCSASINPLKNKHLLFFSKLFGLAGELVTKERRIHDE